jgi:hypothetical protein
LPSSDARLYIHIALAPHRACPRARRKSLAASAV